MVLTLSKGKPSRWLQGGWGTRRKSATAHIGLVVVETERVVHRAQEAAEAQNRKEKRGKRPEHFTIDNNIHVHQVATAQYQYHRALIILGCLLETEREGNA